MKIYEIDFDDKNTKYNYDGLTWKSNGYDLVIVEPVRIDITQCVCLKELIQADFKPIVDWSEVEVDTPVIFIKALTKNKFHFAEYDKRNEKVGIFMNGRTSWTRSGVEFVDKDTVRLAEVENENTKI